ncbi:imelysin family protein [Marinimicrobium sp. ABcell2]|uniref:imelysin family protein n=1 Tax=Marinimicrobium sp. ABcell2 TaxID=3069751 RepID=UPI0027B49DFD|nr:imelysin family protein [Marinimicrobium sp. ABcell2]MDQ2076546.1 imelysin family protein [Marinimicrobium sp. ABcell2]
MTKLSRPRQFLYLCLALVVALGTGCERKSPDPDPAEIPTLEPVGPLGAIDPLQETATLAIWNRGSTLLEQALVSREDLHQSLESLLENPTEETLNDAQEAWRGSHADWHRLDPLLALADSNPGLFPRLQRRIFNIDAHPLQPGYIDYVEAYPYSGIVNDISLTINASTLRAQHGLTDAGDVALGFHALEFLLWGEHGQRDANDFTVTRETTSEQRSAGFNIADLPNNRRRDMLLLLSHLLRDDLNGLTSRWQDRDGWLHGTYHQLHPAARAQLWKNASQHYLEQAQQHVHNLNRDSGHSPFAAHTLASLAAGLIELKTLLSEEETSLLPWFSDAEFAQQWLEALSATIILIEANINAERELSEEVHKQLLEALGDLSDQYAAAQEEVL